MPPNGRPADASAATFLVVDKPAGITSHDVVAAVKAVTGAKKVGHTGTLDPFATGVLPLALNGATRLIQYLDESLKVYDADITLGSRTDTGDPTGQVEAEAEIPPLSEDQIRKTLVGFVGPRMQVPPAYSAVKKDGKKLYQYARAGIEVEVPARPITIYDLELISFTESTVRVKISCSRGTYARVLANEIAEALGTVGHLGSLGRLRSGPFEMSDAIDFPGLSSLVAQEGNDDWQAVLMARGRRTERVPWKRREEVWTLLAPYLKRPVDCLSHLPLADADAEVAKRVRSGGAPPAAPGAVEVGQRFLVVEGDSVVAIAERSPAGPKVLRVF